MENSNNNAGFSTNFGGGCLGSLAVVSIGGIGWFFREKCKHSKSRCGGANSCCQISFQEDSREETKRKTQIIDILRELKIDISPIKEENNI